MDENHQEKTKAKLFKHQQKLLALLVSEPRLKVHTGSLTNQLLLTFPGILHRESRNMKGFIPVFLAILSLGASSPVSQDESNLPGTTADGRLTTVSEGIVSEDLVTTDTPKISRDDIPPPYADASSTNFQYPVEPEVSAREEDENIEHIPEADDGVYHDMSLLKSNDSEYYAGRAPCQCGRPGDRRMPLRIVNGTVVPINDLPWTVALVRKRIFGQPKGAYCGGTLINNRFIVTASHCVDGFAADRIEVRIHEEDFSQDSETEGGTQRVNVDRIIMHPLYNRRTIDNDIALLRLAEPVILDNVVVPACLPANNDYTFENIEGTVAGWGATAEGASVSQVLQKVDVPIISNTRCNTETKYAGKITDNMLCAGDVENGGKDSCQGDSGGPLIIENGGRRTLVGIVSWGYGCARPQSPGVYTRVGRYSDWIVKNTGGADWCSI